jgi:hypothetical protein
MKKIIFGIAVAALWFSPAFADGTIDTLSAGSALGGTEAIPMFQGSNPAVKTTPNAIKTFTNAGVTNPGYVVGNWYLSVTLASGIASGSAGPSLLTAYCGMQLIGGNSSVTISSLALKTTANAGNVQLAIYNAAISGGQQRPSTLIDSTPNIVATSAGNLSGNLNATHSINPGFYWLCMQTDNTILRYASPNNGQTNMVPFIGSSNIGNVFNSAIDGVNTTTGITSFGTWPSFVGATFTEDFNTVPAFAFKFSSVP